MLLLLLLLVFLYCIFPGKWTIFMIQEAALPLPLIKNKYINVERKLQLIADLLYTVVLYILYFFSTESTQSFILMFYVLCLCLRYYRVGWRDFWEKHWALGKLWQIVEGPQIQNLSLKCCLLTCLFNIFKGWAYSKICSFVCIKAKNEEKLK